MTGASKARPRCSVTVAPEVIAAQAGVGTTWRAHQA